MTLQKCHISNVRAHFSSPLPGRSSVARAFSACALALVSGALVVPSLLGDCKCHHPEKGDVTRYGGNMFVVLQEETPYRELKGTVRFHDDSPIEDALVEIFDQPEYLLKEAGRPPASQKRIAACVTSRDGHYCFRRLPAGKYELRASLKAGVNVTHVYVVVDKKAGRMKELAVQMSLGT